MMTLLSNSNQRSNKKKNTRKDGSILRRKQCLQQRLLDKSNDSLLRLFNCIDIPALLLDSALNIRIFTTSAKNLFNIKDTNTGNPVDELNHSFSNLELQADASRVLTTLQPDEKEVVNIHAEYFIQQIKPWYGKDNRVDGVILTYIDVTNLKLTQQSILQSKKRLEQMLKSAGAAMYGVDETGRCTFANNKLIQLTGFREDEMIGRNIHPFIHHSVTDGSPTEWTTSSVYQCLQSGNSQADNPGICWRKDQTSFPACFSVEPITEGNEVSGAIVVLRDMTDELKHNEYLHHLALHDSLTGLFNRHEFENRLLQVLENARQHESKHVMGYLDLDRFKTVNDSCGHLAGDEFLRQITRLLGKQIRHRDTLARLGGDEFGLLMEHCEIIEGKQVARKLRKSISKFNFDWKGGTYSVGVSIGLIEISKDSGNMNDLLRSVDSACYAAKKNGRNRIHVCREVIT